MPVAAPESPPDTLDYTIDGPTGARISGDAAAAGLQEYWSFERSGATQTLDPDKGVRARNCPDCGTPISVNAIGECTCCRAAVTNGTYDWVPQRIDQPDYWRG